MSTPEGLIYHLFHEACPWTAFSVLFGVSLLRYIHQQRRFGSLLLEDWVHMLAVGQCWLLNLVIVFQTTCDLHASSITPSKLEFYRGVPGNVLYWTSTYTSKAVILLFYRRLFRVSPSFSRWWYITLIITILAFLSGLATSFLNCGYSTSDIKPFSWEDPACFSYHSSNIKATSVVRVIAMALPANVLTDCLLLILPLPIILRIQISREKNRLKFIGMTSLVVVTIVLGLFAWLFQLTSKLILAGKNIQNLEPQINGIVAALPVLLLSGDQHARNDRRRMINTNSLKCAAIWLRGGRPTRRDDIESSRSKPDHQNAKDSVASTTDLEAGTYDLVESLTKPKPVITAGMIHARGTTTAIRGSVLTTV